MHKADSKRLQDVIQNYPITLPWGWVSQSSRLLLSHLFNSIPFDVICIALHQRCWRFAPVLMGGVVGLTTSPCPWGSWRWRGTGRSLRRPEFCGRRPPWSPHSERRKEPSRPIGTQSSEERGQSTCMDGTEGQTPIRRKPNPVVVFFQFSGLFFQTSDVFLFFFN